MESSGVSGTRESQVKRNQLTQSEIFIPFFHKIVFRRDNRPARNTRGFWITGGGFSPKLYLHRQKEIYLPGPPLYREAQGEPMEKGVPTCYRVSEGLRGLTEEHELKNYVGLIVRDSARREPIDTKEGKKGGG